MHELYLLLVAEGPAPPLTHPNRLASMLSVAADMEVYPNSLAGADKVLYFLAKSPYDKHLGLVYDASEPPPAADDFVGSAERYPLQGVEVFLKLCARSHENAAALRAHLPFLQPRCLGLEPSFGLGDRLGLATPGHVRAIVGTGLMPCFAQQSIREMTRTGRTPQQVLDDATWGVFQEGYRDGYGADADHLKTLEDVDACAEAGYTLFTIDPGDHVDDSASELDAATLAEKFQQLPWDALESTPTDCRARYLSAEPSLPDDVDVDVSEEALLRAAVKYGGAIAHTVALYRRLVERRGGGTFEVEVSVDETASPTTPFEHYYVASELRRLGVRWVSLAPRFIGEFEKAVDYKGELPAFEVDFARHAAIARELGPYKLSIHSGSDKFSIYSIAARLTNGLVHVKTAGTSYLEALRTIAAVAPELFRDILAFACERYAEDRATYNVSADPAAVPHDTPNDDLPALLDDDNVRQVLHVTYGSVLNARREDGRWRFRDLLLDTLRRNEEVYAQVLQRHLARHIEPFRRD